MQLKSLADLFIFLCLNIVGIFLLLSLLLFFASIISKRAKEKIHDVAGFSYRKINRIVFFAIIAVFGISYFILGKDFFLFFENKFIVIVAIGGFINFIYTGWLQR